MNDMQHRALNWESLLSVTAEAAASAAFDEVEHLGLSGEPLLLHSRLYADLLGVDSSLLGDAYLANRSSFETMDPTITILDSRNPAWPRQIDGVAYRPRFLYAVGDLTLLRTQSISILGARHPSIGGRELAERSVKTLAKAGFPVLTGVEPGIGAVVAKTLVEEGTPSITVLPTPLETPVATNGVVISRFAPSTKPEKWHMLLRNRLVGALSSASLIIEEREGGGALSQGAFALENGRLVILFQEVVDNHSLLWPRTFAQHDGVLVVKRIQNLARSTRRALKERERRAAKYKESMQLDLFS